MDSSHITAVILVPSIVFMVIVAPLWVWLHYRSKRRAQVALTESERDNLEALLLKSEAMMERIDTLESILDAQTPEWRKHDR
ncbi:MAG: envelope stress response membrane protein PspB [Gammaproteobacteria bacterium]|jgi:phage shock protein B|nr:envelope stress response membrane protein PspB [Gammaproteobacteria bacterium]|tara:strand:+ start:783 stop:1028 length:246 start_codon:yes stop_codon:yes gene_type:complete